MFREKEAGEALIERGLLFNRKIGREQGELARGFKPDEGFLVAIANGLTWAGRAVLEKEYFCHAVSYLRRGDPRDLDKAQEYSARSGARNLSQALYGWRQILNKTGLPGVRGISLKRLIDFEKKCFSAAEAMQRSAVIKGIDSWLLRAPFKITVAFRQELWEEEAVNEIRMPAGSQVVKGVMKLFDSGASWVKGYESLRSDFSRLSDIESGLSNEGPAAGEFIHDISKKIALDKRLACAQSIRRVIHVNSGLYLLGKGEINLESIEEGAVML